MGCWNKTCTISQFPIIADDETVNFILVRDGNTGYRDNRPCYPTGAGWCLIPIPFYGKYDDYGWQEDHPGQQHKYDFLAKFYENRLVEVESEKERAKQCYPKLKKPFDNNESLGHTIHGNVWNIKNNLIRYGAKGPENLDIACCMINRIVWDHLTERALQDYPKNKWHTRVEIAEHVQKYIDYRLKAMEELKKQLDEELKNLPKERRSYYATEAAAPAHEYIEKHFKSWYGSPVASAILLAGEREIGGERTEIAVWDLIEHKVVTADDVAAMSIIHNAMHSLRKSFHPQTGEGSQAATDHNHRLLIKAMSAMLKHEKARYED